ncbi:MAG: penicillin-binding transpeptidase domain-containing protein [Ectothiorhodospiraceae bacterium]
MAVALVCRAVDLEVLKRDFLQGQGDARHLRVAQIPAHRGMITDRNGEPLAISSPVDSVWADPGELLQARDRIPALAKRLGLRSAALVQTLQRHKDRQFLYLRRHIPPDRAHAVMSLELPGVGLRREYRRFYPAGEVTSHVLGFTNIDDHGQEGLELAFDDWLEGEPGAKRVVRDRLGREVETVEQIRKPRPGKNLTLAMDRRLQYLAYRELKTAVRRHHAKSGSLVLLDARTGEVLAMVNQPAFNPNNRSEIRGSRYRNRAVTDVYEPGSTMKPFTVSAALESGKFRPQTKIDTSPGVIRVGHSRVRDERDYGVIDLPTLIRKSSNVGASKIALTLDPDAIWGLMSRVGFGQGTGSAFPGEVTGHLSAMPPRSDIERATLAFGYGISVTPLQLARAYTVIASGGVLRPVSFIKRDDAPKGRRILDAPTVREVRHMMEGVVSDTGTAPKAKVPGYRVAGKTGTVKKSVAGGYSDHRYLSLFAGMAPASNPRFVCVVLVDEPQGDEYYGGLVAAPVFREVMAGALRLWNVPPDGKSGDGTLLMAQGGDL